MALPISGALYQASCFSSRPYSASDSDINWLLDVIAPNQKTTANVIANFKQVVKDGDLRLHPIVTKLVDAETLEKMGAQKVGRGDAE